MSTTTTTYRAAERAESNNPANPNQNVCALAVANALGVAGNVRYLHNLSDTLRAARTAYSVRSRLSAVGGLGKTVGAIRAKLAEQGARYYIVHVKGHVLLLGADGSTLIDTNPRQRDRRAVRYVYGVFPKAG